MKTSLKELPKKTVLRFLIDNLDDNNNYILLLSQWNSNEHDKTLGVISDENYRICKTRIEHGVNSFIEDLSEKDMRKVLVALDLESNCSRPFSSAELKFKVLQKISLLLSLEDSVIDRRVLKELNLNEYLTDLDQIISDLFTNGLIDEPVAINAGMKVISRVTLKGKEYLRQRHSSNSSGFTKEAKSANKNTNLKWFRIMHGLPQIEMANKIGIDRMTYAQIEAGKMVKNSNFMSKFKSAFPDEDFSSFFDEYTGSEGVKKKQLVLFLAANPSSKAKLNLGKEHSTISRVLEGKSIVCYSKFAVSVMGMNEEVEDKNPTIIHFAGHGLTIDVVKKELREVIPEITNDTGLVFQNEDNSGSTILGSNKAKQIFRDLILDFAPELQAVVLNACYSQDQAIAISENNIYTIGTANKIKDEAAIAFSKGFYRHFAKTNDIVMAFKFGRLQANSKTKGDARDLIHLFYNGKKVQL